ncbi:MAG: cytochrome b [Betaproteobacteria bacterium]|nr:cytochrome b [Betaproteobacteria bacterium]
MNQYKYDTTAITLHWLVALLIVIAFSVGHYMADLDLSPWKLKVFAWHKWVGVTIFGLVLFRMMWRATHVVPPLPAGMSELMRKISGLGHLGIYLLMLAIPLTGWLHSSAAGVTVVYFNVITLPDLVQKNKELSNLFKEVHELLNWTLLGLVILHVVAALKHQFVDKDNLLNRMRW